MLEENNSRPTNLRDLKSGSDKHLNKRSEQPYFTKYTNFTRGEIKRVSKRQPCSICHKPDWCSYTIDDFGISALALCMRNSGSNPNMARNGAFIHVLSDMPQIPNYVKPQIIEAPKADIKRCDAVYTALLNRLEDFALAALESRHGDNLLERGLGDDTIARKLYASVPTKEVGDKLAQALSKEFDLTGVAGFYKDKLGNWCLKTGYWFEDAENNWKWFQYEGFFIPYRSHEGLIAGLQIRLDTPLTDEAEQTIDKSEKLDKKPNRYIWLSSRNKSHGASSGTPLHFVNADIIRETRVAFITEGALKADVIAELGEIGVIAIAGVRAVKAEILVETVKTLFPNLERVSLAFDRDFLSNEAVNEALTALETAFQQWEGLDVSSLIWDKENAKGFDDYLLSEIRGEK